MKYRYGITWLTCLSLDAPLVAIVWQNAISTRYALEVDWHHRVLVFLSVWLGYSADRWFDAWRHRQNISQRHRFFSDHRWALLVIWILTLAGTFGLALQSLNSNELICGFCLTFSSIAVTLFAQFGRLRHFRSLTKSALTAMLVTASASLFAFPENVGERISTLFLLFAIFTLNCSFIHCWDRSIDAAQERRPSDPARYGGLQLAYALASLALVAFHQNPLFVYAFASTLLLAAVHALRNRLHAETRRTLADLSLLTPLALFF